MGLIMLNYKNQHALVSTNWLHDNLNNVTVIDATWYLPDMGKDAKAEYDKAHIKDAIYFNIDDLRNKNSDLPHMLPTAEEFSQSIGKFGINNDDHIVVYDAHGLFSAARIWWMFRIFGHDKISILNGGGFKWRNEEKPMDDDIVNIHQTSFQAEIRPELICHIDDIFTNLENGKSQILDARPKARYDATSPEPRPGMRSGHIPKSKNLPFSFLLDATSKEILPAKSLLEKFDAENIDINQPIICSCGSGVTACILAFCLYLVGKDDAVIYDGSWAQWGSLSHTPIDS